MSSEGAAAAADAAAAAQQQGGDDEEYKVMAEGFKNEGNDAFKQGRYAEAIGLYSQGIDIDPDNHVLYSNRSAAYLKENERGKALKDAEKLMELKPDWPKSFSRKGAAQHALTRYTAAIETYQEGLRLFPEDKALQDGLKAAEEAYEVDKKARFEKARLEREAAEARKKQEEEAAAAKQKAEEEAKAVKAKESTGDELADFFSDIGGGDGAGGSGAGEMGVAHGANIQREVVKTIKEDYAKADLGSSEDQVARLLQSNYAWKNLNPYEVLQLGTDATEDDIKMRYRKLSTLVHPDKCLHIENARDAFEEVKKAYNQLIDEERRTWCILTINETRKRTLKERKQKIAKGMTPAQLGPEEEAVKKAIMKEFAEVEMRKRNAERHQQAYKQFEQQKEDEEKRKMQEELEFDKRWTDEASREGRVGNWRDFQKGPGAKRARVQAWATEENVKDKGKHGQVKKEEWRKSWK